VHEHDAFERAALTHGAREGHEVGLVRMGGEAVQDDDLRLALHPCTEHAHFVAPFDESPSQRVRCLEADDHDGVAAVVERGALAVTASTR